LRISQAESQAITQSIYQYCEEEQVSLYLYGSRVDDHLKGGDIDLLLIVTDQKKLEFLLSVKHNILAAMKKAIGDQKIDLIITDPQIAQQDVFIKKIFNHAVQLY